MRFPSMGISDLFAVNDANDRATQKPRMSFPNVKIHEDGGTRKFR